MSGSPRSSTASWARSVPLPSSCWTAIRYASTCRRSICCAMAAILPAVPAIP
ncbi:hypothetical protein [Fodinicola feengrottensis]|uniref:hypothetical protein n=1 Tax=Fodinicola feengrottensis TaxID=435914 RepID=UPI002440FEC1|nr:hypothetical protein [Fodinicola feengrottensis]